MYISLSPSLAIPFHLSLPIYPPSLFLGNVFKIYFFPGFFLSLYSFTCPVFFFHSLFLCHSLSYILSRSLNIYYHFLKISFIDITFFLSPLYILSASLSFSLIFFISLSFSLHHILFPFGSPHLSPYIISLSQSLFSKISQVISFPFSFLRFLLPPFFPSDEEAGVTIKS